MQIPGIYCFKTNGTSIFALSKKNDLLWLFLQKMMVREEIRSEQVVLFVKLFADKAQRLSEN